MIAERRTKPICLYCDHWAQYQNTHVGFCTMPASPHHSAMGILAGVCKHGIHSVRVDSCDCFTEVTRAEGPDRRGARQTRGV